MLMEQIESADKVVIGRYWFALVDGVLMCSALSTTGRLNLVDAEPVSDVQAAVTHVGVFAGEFDSNARRAALMLRAVDVSDKLAIIIQKLDEADAHIERAQGYLSAVGSGPAMRADLTAQQRADAEALTRGTPVFSTEARP